MPGQKPTHSPPLAIAAGRAGHRTRLLFALLGAFALAACASTRATGPAENPALMRFQRLCRFLPDDMESYWLTDERQHPDDWRSVAALRVRAGRDFEPPTDVGVGRHTFVEAADYLGSAKPESVLEDPIPAEPIAGHATWTERDKPDTARTWVVIVDGRFVVHASSRQRLEQALAQSGSLERILATLPDAPRISPDASDVLLLRLRPQPKPTAAGFLCAVPSPEAPLVAQLFAEGTGFCLQVTTEPAGSIEAYYRRWSEFADYTVGDPHPNGDIHAFDVHFPEFDWLQLALLFGMNIFI